MIAPLSIMGFFCEDIREELNNIVTVIGLMPDNANLAVPQEDEALRNVGALSQARILGKLCVFARANYGPDDPVSEINLLLEMPGKERLEIGMIGSDIIEKSKVQAKEKGNPLAGATMRAILGGFQFPREGGVISLLAQVENREQLIAILNISAAKGDPSSASEQPS